MVCLSKTPKSDRQPKRMGAPNLRQHRRIGNTETAGVTEEIWREDGMMTANGLAKLIEETGELQQIAGKKLAYFYTDEHPDGNGSLKERLEDEMGDVIAAIQFVSDCFGLDKNRIQQRIFAKLNTFDTWQKDPGNHSDSFEAPPQ